MTLADIVNMLTEMNIPFAYRAFEADETAPAPPFICYFFPNNIPEPADDANAVQIEELDIELYTPYKDFELETSIETILTNHDLAFSRDESWIDSEKMQLTLYTMEVVINGKQDPIRT